MGAEPTPKAATNAVRTELVVQGLTDPSNNNPSAAVAATVARAAINAAPATQVRKPWRSTARTVVQIVLGFAPLLPAIVSASGVDGSLPAVGAALALSATITRVMALPGVEAFLQRFVPWLAASPRPAGG